MISSGYQNTMPTKDPDDALERETQAAETESVKARKVNPRHLSGSNEHGTPRHIVEAARNTLGAIDLDPASTQKMNRIVRAQHFYCAESNGLAHPWNGRVFLNPPGGRDPSRNESRQKIWWHKLQDEYEAGRVTSAIFVSFSLEFMQTSQVPMRPDAYGYSPATRVPMQFPHCIPSRRLAYLKEDGTPGNSPPHASAIFFLPPPNEDGETIGRFLKAFDHIGFTSSGGHYV